MTTLSIFNLSWTDLLDECQGLVRLQRAENAQSPFVLYTVRLQATNPNISQQTHDPPEESASSSLQDLNERSITLQAFRYILRTFHSNRIISQPIQFKSRPKSLNLQTLHIIAAERSTYERVESVWLTFNPSNKPFAPSASIQFPRNL